jgi:uracil-DNA glycosylase
MRDDLGIFPFGKPVRKIEQSDRSPKRTFVLGVYASAVHAQWIDKDGRTLVRALAVDSEPYIFWKGDGAADIVDQIEVPHQVGRLVPAHAQFNGPSGIALDEKFLNPLNLTREESWLCDLLPRAYMNPAQKQAIERAYLPLAKKYNLPLPTVPVVPNMYTDEARRHEIKEEIKESEAEILVLLGDQPIKWFLRYYAPRWQKLSDFGTTPELYGKLHEVELGETEVRILPLAHPRQVARLGRSSDRWYSLHQSWLQKVMDNNEPILR